MSVQGSEYGVDAERLTEALLSRVPSGSLVCLITCVRDLGTLGSTRVPGTGARTTVSRISDVVEANRKRRFRNSATSFFTRLTTRNWAILGLGASARFGGSCGAYVGQRCGVSLLRTIISMLQIPSTLPRGGQSRDLANGCANYRRYRVRPS